MNKLLNTFTFFIQKMTEDELSAFIPEVRHKLQPLSSGVNYALNNNPSSTVINWLSEHKQYINMGIFYNTNPEAIPLMHECLTALISEHYKGVSDACFWCIHDEVLERVINYCGGVNQLTEQHYELLVSNSSDMAVNLCINHPLQEIRHHINIQMNTNPLAVHHFMNNRNMYRLNWIMLSENQTLFELYPEFILENIHNLDWTTVLLQSSDLVAQLLRQNPDKVTDFVLSSPNPEIRSLYTLPVPHDIKLKRASVMMREHKSEAAYVAAIELCGDDVFNNTDIFYTPNVMIPAEPLIFK